MHLGAPVARIGELGFDDLCLALQNQGAEFSPADVGIAELHRLRLGDQLIDKGVVNVRLGIDALDGQADLPGIEDGAAQHRVAGLIQIGIAQHDGRILAAEFQEGGNEAAGRGCRHLAASRHAAGEADQVRLLDQRRAGFAIAQNESQNLAKAGRRVDGLAQRLDEAWRHFAGLDQRRAAGGEGRHGVDQGQGDGKVPRRDEAGQRIGNILIAVA